mmetsp:Transcript_3777/g.9199  ORF Transcript_3777/g.9199 Transcript_3777/m.9199 type:complete len:460 (+) Transcript_3777:194-1573(+)
MLLLVPRRAVLRVGGSSKDAARQFLQGLCTQDMFRWPSSTTTESQVHQVVPRTRSAAAAFLNPKGRVLCDVLLQEETTESFLLDCSAETHASLLKLLKRHKLRQPLVVEDASGEFVAVAGIRREVLQLLEGDGNATEGVSPAVVGAAPAIPAARGLFDASAAFLGVAPPSGGGGNTDTTSTHQKHEQQQISFRDPSWEARLQATLDPRTALLGPRLMVPKEAVAIPASPDTGVDWLYDRLRYTLGVPEGPADLTPEKALVHRSNLDLLAFVGFEKGCYTGQELTIRTHHRGQVRRRTAVVCLKGAAGASPPVSAPAALKPGAKLYRQPPAEPTGTAPLEQCGELTSVLEGRVALCSITGWKKEDLKKREDAAADLGEQSGKCRFFCSASDDGEGSVKVLKDGRVLVGKDDDSSESCVEAAVAGGLMAEVQLLVPPYMYGNGNGYENETNDATQERDSGR